MGSREREREREGDLHGDGGGGRRRGEQIALLSVDRGRTQGNIFRVKPVKNTSFSESESERAIRPGQEIEKPPFLSFFIPSLIEMSLSSSSRGSGYCFTVRNRNTTLCLTES